MSYITDCCVCVYVFITDCYVCVFTTDCCVCVCVYVYVVFQLGMQACKVDSGYRSENRIHAIKQRSLPTVSAHKSRVYVTKLIVRETD